MRETDYGIFIFEGEELDIAMRWMWGCLCDLSFKGKIEVIIQVIFYCPPKFIYKETPNHVKN